MPANRTETGQFQKGQSGNPSGRPKNDPEIIAILRPKTKEMARRLVELTRSENEKVALQAIMAAFDRVYGKPVQASEVNMDVSGGLDLTAQIHAALLRREEERRNGTG